MMRFFRRAKSNGNTEDKPNAAPSVSESAPPEAKSGESSKPLESTPPTASSSPAAPRGASGDSSPSTSSSASAPNEGSAPSSPTASSSASAPGGASGALSVEEQDRIREEVFDQTRTIFDPEIPVSIHALGLIYGVDVSEDGKVFVRMTLTAPNCPAAGSLPVEVKMKAQGVAGVTEAEVAVVWEPVWNKDMMSEEAKLELGFL